MAINVNTVYQTVLLILNKEQRGYMTPVEFNKIGGQVQLEIFEKYAEDMNQQLRVPQIDLDYSDRQINVDEKLSIFKEIDTATYTTSGHQIPFQYSGNSSTTQSWTSTTNQLTYPLIGDSISFAAKNAISNVFVDEIQYSPDQYTVSGGNLILNGTAPLAGTAVVINLYSKQFYRLGTVIYSAGGTLPIQELERVGSSELYHLLSSNLTKPTTKYPIYTYKNNYINVYPQSIDFGISVNYLRKPIPPIWGMNSQITTSYQFQPSGSMNFELHSSEQTELILKILLYAGVVIRDPEIVKVAASQVQQQEINQKS
jgi:hypothetical protein